MTIDGKAVQAVLFITADVVAKLVPPAALPIAAGELLIQELERRGFIRVEPSEADLERMRETQAHVAADISSALTEYQARKGNP